MTGSWETSRAAPYPERAVEVEALGVRVGAAGCYIVTMVNGRHDALGRPAQVRREPKASRWAG